MNQTLKKDETWVYVVIQNPGPNEQFAGIVDQQEGIDFIPAYQVKEDAQQSYPYLPRKENTKYEVQAILLEDLIKQAVAHNFWVYILNSRGKVVTKYQP